MAWSTSFPGDWVTYRLKLAFASVSFLFLWAFEYCSQVSSIRYEMVQTTTGDRNALDIEIIKDKYVRPHHMKRQHTTLITCVLLPYNLSYVWHRAWNTHLDFVIYFFCEGPWFTPPIVSPLLWVMLTWCGGISQQRAWQGIERTSDARENGNP